MDLEPSETVVLPSGHFTHSAEFRYDPTGQLTTVELDDTELETALELEDLLVMIITPPPVVVGVAELFELETELELLDETLETLELNTELELAASTGALQSSTLVDFAGLVDPAGHAIGSLEPAGQYVLIGQSIGVLVSTVIGSW